MRIIAVILSCVVLILSAGIGRALPLPEKQTEQCCNCDKESAGDCGNNANHNQHKAVCPFCAGSFAKGLNVLYAIALQPSTQEYHHDRSLYVCHKYIPPVIGAVWQPPKTGNAVICRH